MSGDKNVQEYQYKAEMKQLLDIIIHSLYTHPEIFLRELISNASDALNKLKIKKLSGEEVSDTDAELAIRIDVDDKKHTFSISDTGIGMTSDDLVNNIGTIARSGTSEFLKSMKESGEAADKDLIGRFGVGFYSTFMVADEVFIKTKCYAPGSAAYLWNSKGEGSFSVAETEKDKRGTDIYFTFKSSAREYSDSYRIRGIIEKYSGFVDFPIYLNGEKVNTTGALWRRKKEDIKESELSEFYKFIANDYEEPLGHIILSIEGSVNFKALLFIPSAAPFDLFKMQQEKGLHLYSNKVLIQNNCKELLPEYLRFARGVVDTTDLPLNVSREVAQTSPYMTKINNMLTSEILSYLTKMSETDAEKFKKFYSVFGTMLKAGVNSDFKNRDKIIELLRFESSKTARGEYTTFINYYNAMKPEQKEIYYIAGENGDIVESNPNLEFFRKNEIEVLFLLDAVDVFVVPAIGEYKQKQIKSIEKGDIDVLPEGKIETVEDNLSKSVIKIFKEVLKDKVSDVRISKRLFDWPVTLVTAKDGVEPHMEKILKIMHKDYVPREKRVLEVNMDHKLIKNISGLFLQNAAEPMIETCILQLFEGALYMEGSLNQASDFIKRMNNIMEKATGNR